jgi:hypothetical protein
MGLLGFVDKIIGTDLSGEKAGKYYKEGAAAQQQATQQALATMTKYGDKALSSFMEYMNRGMSEEDAMNQAAMQALQEGDQQAIQAYNEQYQAGMEARQPYEQAGTSMLGALPYLQAAMGLPSDQQFDVAASPMYQWQKEQMDQELTAQLNAMGLSGDNAAAFIRSQNLGQLGAQETQRQMADLQNMVQGGLSASQSLGQPQFQAARDLAGLYGGSASNQAGLLQQAAMNRGNTLSGMGQSLAGFNLGMGANQANALLAGGQSAMNMGISRAQQPNAMNQLLNTGIGLFGMGGGRSSSRLPAMNNRQQTLSDMQTPGRFGMGAVNTLGAGNQIMLGMSGIPGASGFRY